MTDLKQEWDEVLRALAHGTGLLAAKLTGNPDGKILIKEKPPVFGSQMGRDMADCLDQALIDAILDLSRVAKGWPDRWVPAVQRLGVKTFTGMTTLPGEYPK